MYSNSCSSALEAIQDYGPGRQSQSYLSHERDSNIRSAYKNTQEGFNFAKKLEATHSYTPGRQSISDSPISYDRITPSDSSSNKLFDNLNLKTVEEEDEFLYGDSSSLPEAPKSFREETVNRDIQKCDAGWSDEELFDEPSSKQESVWKVRERIEAKKLSLSRQGKKSSFEGNILKKTTSEHVYSPQHSPSPKLDTKRINLQLTEYENFTEKQFPFAAEKSSAGNKSKYHAAAEILKKKVLEKSNTRIETSESFNMSSKPTDFANTAKTSEKEKNESKADKTSTKSQRQLPKAFSQKDLDNVKNYLKGSPQKRLYPEEYEPESKQSRYETSRHLSPSESKYPRHEHTRHNSLYDSPRHRSPVRDYRHRSPHSRHRSPVKDLRTRLSHHSSYDYRTYSHDVRRHHSRSPPRRSRSRSPRRRSREKSSDRHYRRSPGSYRSRERSRSPSSRDRYYEKSSRRSDRSPEHYPSLKKKREDRDSAESFCSLSLSSDSDSSDSSERSSRSDEKRRPYLKSSAANEDKRKKDTTKPEDKVLNPSTKTNDTSASFLSEDVSKTLADIFNRQNQTPETDISSEIFKPSNTEEQDKIDNVNNIFKILEQSQIISEVLGQHQHASSYALTTSSNTNAVATSKILPVSNPQLLPMSNHQHFTMSNPQLPTMPYPQSYSYPAMAAGPIPYPPPPFFPSAAPSPPVCPPPVVPPVPPPVAPPVPPPVAPPVVPPVPSMSIQAESTVKSRFTAHRPPPTLRQISTNPSVDSSNLPPQNSKPSVEKSPAELKGTGFVRKNESPKLKEAEQNSQKYKDAIEKFKKMKHDRSIIRLQVNNSSTDMIKMRSMLQETWGRNAKVSHSDKVLQTKCKNLVTSCSENLNRTTEKAKLLDREIKKILEKLPKSLQQELSKFRSEDYKEKDNSTERYSCLDPGSHYCNECGANFKNIADVLEHIQDSQHQKNLEEEDSNKDSKERQKKDDVEKCTFKYVKGIEFLKPMTGFHCVICKETIDSSRAEEHVKSHEHYVNYKKYSNLHPLYESYVVLKRYIHLSMVARVKKVKEDEEKKKQSENLNKEVLLEEKEKGSKTDKRHKEKVEVEEDKETSPGEKADGKAKTKTMQKFNFIGKAPNFKKTLDPKVVKPKPWYKRESILNQKEEDNKPSDSLDIKAKISKLGEKTFEQQFKKPNIPESSARPVKEDNPKRSVSATCLSKEESEKNKRGISKSNSEKSVSSKSVPLPLKESSIPQTDDPIVNRAIKNILGHSSPPRESVSLQEINLPKTTDVETVNLSTQLASNNKEDKQPIPMDIDNSQDSKSVSKIVTEEEKDLYILGINKDDLKPLVIPVPPPSYSGNTASYLPSNNSGYDYSFADPTVLNYVRNTPPPNHPHSNTNNAQTGTSYSNIQGQLVHPYSNQTSMLPVNPYPNTSNTPIISYPNTRVPPPLPPYGNTHSAMPYMPQYSNPNNMTYSNNMSSMPRHSSTSQFLNQNVPSAPTKNFNVNLSGTNTVQSPTKVNKKQVSEIKPVARTLVTIVPTVKQSKSVRSNDLKDEKTENKANSSENLTDKSSEAKKDDNLVEKQDRKNDEKTENKDNSSENLTGSDAKKEDNLVEKQDSKNDEKTENKANSSSENLTEGSDAKKEDNLVEKQNSKNDEKTENKANSSSENLTDKGSNAKKEDNLDEKQGSKNNDAKELLDNKESCTEKEQSMKVKNSKNNESEVLSKDAKELPDSKETESTEKDQSIELKESVPISIQKTEICDTFIEMKSSEMSSKDDETMKIDNLECDTISEFGAPTKLLDKNQMIDNEPSQKYQEMPKQNQTFDESMDVGDKGLSTTLEHQSVGNNEKVGVLNEASEKLLDGSSNIKQQNVANNEKVGVLKAISVELMDDNINLEQENTENKESISNYNQGKIDLDDPKTSDLHKTENETNKIDNLDSICVSEASIITDASNELIEKSKEMQNNDESMEISDQDFGFKPEQQSVSNAEKAISDNSHLKEFSDESNICGTSITKTLTEQSPENCLAEKTDDDDKTSIISLTITQNNEFKETQNTHEKMEIDDMNFGFNPEQQDAQIRIKVCDFDQAKHIPEQIEICDSLVTKTSAEESSKDSSNNKLTSSDVAEISTSTFKKDCGFSEKCQKIEETPSVNESEELSDKNCVFKPDEHDILNKENASCDMSQVEDVYEKPEVCNTFDEGISEEYMEIVDEYCEFKPDEHDIANKGKAICDLSQVEDISKKPEVCNTFDKGTSEDIEIIEIIDDDSDFQPNEHEIGNKEKAICDLSEVKNISKKPEVCNTFNKRTSKKDIEIIEIIDDDSDFEPDETNTGNNEKAICDLNKVVDISEKPEVRNTFGEGTSDENKEIKNYDVKTGKIIEVDVKNQSIKEKFTTVTNQRDEITDSQKNINIKQEVEDTIEVHTFINQEVEATFKVDTVIKQEVEATVKVHTVIKQEVEDTVDQEVPVDQTDIFIPPTATNADQETSKAFALENMGDQASHAQCGESSTDDLNDNNTTATFADISSSLDKLQKVVTEVNAKVELQEKKEKKNNETVRKIGSLEFNQELEKKEKVDSETGGKIGSFEFNQEPVIQDIENASETFLSQSVTVKKEKVDSDTKEKSISVALNQEPEKKCDDSDTDEYEEKEE